MSSPDTHNLPVLDTNTSTGSTAPSMLERSNLTKSQLLIWTGQKLNPEAPLYNMVLAFTLDGAIAPDTFDRAFNHLVTHTDAMRTVIEEHGGVPRQRVLDTVPAPTEHLDLTHEPQPHGAYKSWVQDRCVLTLDLARCMYDSVLVKLANQRYVWYLNQHHLITDGWATALVYRRMSQMYQHAIEGKLSECLPPPQYADYIRHEQAFRDTKQYTKAIRYWSERLAHPADPTDFYGKTNPGSTPKTQRVPFDLGDDRSAKLKAVANEKGIRSLTPDLSQFNIFMTVLFATLYRVGQNRKVMIGTPSHNRPTPAFKDTDGLFIEIHPMGIEMDDEETFESLITKVSSETINMLRHALPGSSDFAHNNAYSVLLNYIHASFPAFDGIPVRSDWVHSGYGDRRHSLRLQVHDFDEKGSFLLHFDLNRDVFSAQLREAIVNQFVCLLDAFLDDHTQRLDEVDLLTPTDKGYLVDTYNDTQSDYPNDCTVIRYFEDQAAATPSNTAIESGAITLTYAQLNAHANQLANYMRSVGVTRGDVVAVHMDRSTDVVVAFLAALKAGAAYVPMDMGYTPERLEFVINETNARVVLTHAELVNQFKDTSKPIVCIDRDWDAIAQYSKDNLTDAAGPDDLAYLIYTSGSTGIPKGVMVPHRGLANYIWWAKKVYIGQEQLAFPLFSSISFDLTVTSIYVPLISGNKIVVYEESDDQADMAIMRVIEDDAVGVIKLTPSHLSLLRFVQHPPKNLKNLILGGEDLKCDLAKSITELLGNDIALYNEYGPTEATVGCMIHKYDPAVDREGSVPVGTPADNMRIYILDNQLRPVPLGVQGEMYIGGIGVASGYLHRPELTANCFIDDPFVPNTKLYRTGDMARWDGPGRMIFMGRKDGQVKIRGARVEVGEVETAILNHNKVNACIVDVVEGDGHTRTARHVDYCVRCGLPSNFPGLSIGKNGVCSVCVEYDEYHDQARAYFKTMEDLHDALERGRQRKEGEHDCLMLLSGGKDSTYALYQVVEMGYRPLVFSLDNGYISDGAKANIRRAVDSLGLELVWGTTPDMNAIFTDSLRRHSNVCQGCFKTIYTLSTNLAKQRGIKAIVTGLSRGQVFETRIADLFHAKIFDPKQIDHTIIEARKAYHRMDDEVSRCLDVAIFNDDTVFDDIEFIDFYRYSNVELDDMLDFLSERAPWVRPSDTGRSTNCLINEAGIYVHKLERGYHNYALPYSWDVRLGHKQRDAALEELDDQIDVGRVNEILDEVGYTPVDAKDADRTKRLVAYYVASSTLDSTELRQHLSVVLPDYMMPSKLVAIDHIPLNDRGKVDRDALATLALQGTAEERTYDPPTNNTERALADIWQDVLKIEQIGIHENFFDLGGDSILNIQIIARANDARISLTPNQLFDHPTIAGLATQAGQKLIRAEQQGPVKGYLELTPMQRWFFDQELPNPSHWNQTRWITLGQDIDIHILEEALRTVVSHHDSLRLSFIQDSGHWSANFDHHSDVYLDIVKCNKNKEVDIQAQTNQQAERVKASLNIEQGRVMAAALFDFGNDQPRKLLWVIHHLVVDGLSWEYLIEDLASSYSRILNQQTPKLPDKTTSYQQWAQLIIDYSDSDEIHEELDVWSPESLNDVVELPTDHPDGINDERSQQILSSELSPEDTRLLINESGKTYGTNPVDLLVAAFVIWSSGVTSNSVVRIDLESHGREDFDHRANVLRTVGWFTNLYPLSFDLSTSLNYGDQIKTVKERLRQIPRQGVGYGALKYIGGYNDRLKRLRECSKPRVLFSYSGQADLSTSFTNSLGTVEPLLADHGPEGERPHQLVVAASMHGDVLNVEWRFSKNIHNQNTIAQWCDQYTSTLRGLISYCTGNSKREFTPSDFPLAGLDQEKLDKLTSQFGNFDNEG